MVGNSAGIPPEFRGIPDSGRFFESIFPISFPIPIGKKGSRLFFFFFTMTEPIPAINFRVFSAGKFRNSVFGSGIPDSSSPRNRNPKSEFPTKLGPRMT